MANQWFKFYGGEYLSDAKIERLSPAERSCWITLLCMASMTTDGKIEFLTVESLLSKSGIQLDPYNDGDWERCQGIFTLLARMKMIEIDTETATITIKNWEKRQEQFTTNAERQAKYRQNKKSNESVTPVTTKVTLEENRREENKIKNTPAKLDSPFSLKEEIQKLYDNPRRDLNIIGLFLEYRNPAIQNKEQYSVTLKRHLKPAKDLVSFSDDQIIKAMDYAKKEYKDIYTLETIIKILTK